MIVIDDIVQKLKDAGVPPYLRIDAQTEAKRVKKASKDSLHVSFKYACCMSGKDTFVNYEIISTDGSVMF